MLWHGVDLRSVDLFGGLISCFIWFITPFMLMCYQQTNL